MEVENKELNSEQIDELYELAIKANNQQYLCLKVIEEMLELGMLLVKSITKSEGLKPSKEEIIEEIGDVIARLAIYGHTIDPNGDKIHERISGKLAFLHENYSNGKGSKLIIEKTDGNKESNIN